VDLLGNDCDDQVGSSASTSSQTHHPSAMLPPTASPYTPFHKQHHNPSYASVIPIDMRSYPQVSTPGDPPNMSTTSFSFQAHQMHNQFSPLPPRMLGSVPPSTQYSQASTSGHPQNMSATTSCSSQSHLPAQMKNQFSSLHASGMMASAPLHTQQSLFMGPFRLKWVEGTRISKCYGCARNIQNPPIQRPDDLVIVCRDLRQFRDQTTGLLTTSTAPQNCHFHLNRMCVLTRYPTFIPSMLVIDREFVPLLQAEHTNRLATSFGINVPMWFIDRRWKSSFCYSYVRLKQSYVRLKNALRRSRTFRRVANGKSRIFLLPSVALYIYIHYDYVLQSSNIFNTYMFR
jgi:hypothetical protein